MIIKLYEVGIDTVIASSYLLYYFELSNKVVNTETISAHRAYYSVNRRKPTDLRVRSNSSKVNKAGVPASNTSLIVHYRKHKTGGRPNSKEEIQGIKFGTVKNMG